MRPRNLEWAEQDILHALAQAGVVRFARLGSQDALNNRLISGMYARAEASVPFTIRYFADLPAARAWATGS